MQVQPTSLPGLYQITLDLFSDERGSFREAWQREKMVAAGLPAFTPVQQNISVSKRGVIRGIHAEPWDKYIHTAHGEVYAVIIDLRPPSATFGKWEAFTLDACSALFVPQGCGNSFQSLSDPAVYSYLVTAHWKAGTTYPAIAFDDPDLAIPWPLTGSEQIVSAKDRQNPAWSTVKAQLQAAA